ncbi:hypothetical protein SGI37_06535 [Providencia rettgeri]
MIKQADVDSLYDIFKSYIAEDKQNLLGNFSERFQLAVVMEVTLTNNKPELYNHVHAKTIKLSELWYCFELLTTATKYGFGNIKEKSDEQIHKEWLDTQRVSVMGKIDPQKPRKQNIFVDVDLSYNPVGKARLINEACFSKQWFSFFYQDILSEFSLTSANLNMLPDGMTSNALSHYLNTLILHAQGEQKQFLNSGYNALMGNSADITTSSNILSFIYALRCSYVHQGELPDSSHMPIEYKEFILDECIKFLISYCSMAYSTVINEIYLS